MLRVRDLDNSIVFFEATGKRLLRLLVKELYKNRSAFMAFGSGDDSNVLKLTYSWRDHENDNGDANSQIATSAGDVYDAANRFRDNDNEFAIDPGPVLEIGINICAVKDPDR